MSSKEEVKIELTALVRRIKSEGEQSYDSNVSRIVRETIENLGIERAVVGLNTSGCSYKRQSIGCFHCGHLKGYENPEELFQQFISDVSRFKRRDEIFVYSNGSFFDADEIYPDTQIKILRYLADSGFGKIVIESRPDIVSEDMIRQAIQVIEPNRLYVGLGFDTYDNEVRDLCLNKGFSRDDYDKAVSILKQSRIAFETRVVVKPPFLTEKEGIEEAVKTVGYSFEKGTDSVSLEPLALQRYTLQDYLHRKGKYRVPWLWSLIEIVRETQQYGKITVSGENFIPLPYETVHNCNECTSEVKNAIHQFNETQQLRKLDGLDCGCKDSWNTDLSRKYIGLYGRVINQIR